MSSETRLTRVPMTRAEARNVRANQNVVAKLRRPGIRENPKKKKKSKDQKGRKLHVVDPRTGVRYNCVHPAFARWVQALHRPRWHRGVQCPVNDNPSPSNVVLSPTVSWSDQNVVVEPGKCVQIVLFPGRNVQGTGDFTFTNALPPAGVTSGEECGPGDEVALHTRLVAFADAGDTSPDKVVSVAPVPYTLHVNVAGVVTATVPTNVIGLISKGASADDALLAGKATCWFGGGAGVSAGKWTRMVPDVPVGIAGSDGNGHLRHKLTSMDISVRNTTPVLNKGGTIVSVLPTNKFGDQGSLVNHAFSQNLFERYGTYTIHQKDEMYLSWVPRPGELAFAHPAVSTQASAANLTQALQINACPWSEGAGVYVWLNNPTAVAQSYSVFVVQNYDLAGQGVAQLGQPAEHHPQLQAAVQKGIAIATSGSHTVGPAMIEGAKATLQQAAGRVSADALAGLEGLAKSLGTKAAAGALALVGHTI